MLGYVTIGTNDFDRAVRFFDQLLADLGGTRYLEMDRVVAWTAGPGTPGIGVCKPYDGNAATTGNGTMVALAAGSEEQVQAIHRKALALGGTDEGAPGRRFGTFYAAYFRDLDGNKFCVFHISRQSSE